MGYRRRTLIALVFFGLIEAAIGHGHAASNLTLAPSLSFDDDSSANFPIRGENLPDSAVASHEATIIFIGTAHCWNTSREAERLIKLYPQYRDHVHFIIIDLQKPGPGQDELVEHYYHGYIPTIAVIDARGKLLYDRAGETAAARGDTINLQRLLDAAK